MASATVRPSGRGSINGLTDQPSAGANWDKVDEAVSDGDSTFVYLNDPSALGAIGQDLYAVPSISPLGEVKSVTVSVVAKETLGGTNTVAPLLYVDGQTYTGTISALTGSYATYSYTFYPAAGGWDEMSVDGMEIGVRFETNMTTTLGAVRCTQVYAVVSYDYSTYMVTVPAGRKISIGSGQKLSIGQET